MENGVTFEEVQFKMAYSIIAIPRHNLGLDEDGEIMPYVDEW